MMSDPLADKLSSEGPTLTCSWAPVGVGAAEVLVVGELDMATAPQLTEALMAAAQAAPLTLVVMTDVTFVDAAGIHTLLDAAEGAHRAGRKLVLTPVHPNVQRLLDLLELRDAFDLLDPPPVEAAGVEALVSAGAGMPPRNPVNAAIVPARAMAVPDRRLWMQTETGVIERAWAPAEPLDELTWGGRPIELYVDHDGQVNGWRDVISGLAVNQRRFDDTTEPLVGTPMRCQGSCGRTWHAPAAAAMIEHDEHCLTCAGPLAPS